MKDIITMKFLILSACLFLPATAQETGWTLTENYFNLTVTPDTEVMKLVTRDVKLRCESDKELPFPIAWVVRIEIEKKSFDNSWEFVADVLVESDIKSKGGWAVTGIIRKGLAGSFLEISWPVATAEMIGEYRCNIEGYWDHFYFNETTPTVEIIEKNLSLSTVLEIVLDEKQKTRKVLQELSQNWSNFTEETNNTIRDLNERLDEVESKLDSFNRNMSDMNEQIAQLNCTLPPSPHTDDDRGWPRGPYALLKPDSGCPLRPEFVHGEEGTYSLHTESSDGNPYHPQHNMSDNIRLSKPIVHRNENNANLLYLRFCAPSMTVTDNDRPSRWPRGSYCVSKIYGVSCPFGMKPGCLEIDEEDDHKEGSVDGSFLHRSGYLSFCCTSTGPHNYQITLPTNDPFYLFRYRGRCQQVTDMSVREEFLTIDTENHLNNDRFKGRHPDGSVDHQKGRLTLRLCYYYK